MFSLEETRFMRRTMLKEPRIARPSKAAAERRRRIEEHQERIKERKKGLIY